MAIIGHQSLEGAFGLKHAMAYCRAAQAEENNGFAFTAAVDWQRAAESLTAFPSLAAHCWLQWERIMRLPRRLADPIAEMQTVSVQTANAAHFDAVSQAELSEREVAEVFAQFAETLFIHNIDEVNQPKVDFPIIEAAQSMAAAA